MLKSFRYTLTEIHLTLKEIAELFRMTKLAILPIKDVKQYAVIISKQQEYKNEISQKEKQELFIANLIDFDLCFNNPFRWLKANVHTLPGLREDDSRRSLVTIR